MALASISYSTFDPNNPANERILGTERIENIEEVLIPLNDKNSPIFITKVFSGETCKRWRVAFVLGITASHWGIWLIRKDVSRDIYLSKIMAEKHICHPGSLLRKGSLVIAEFGHIYKTLNFQSGLSHSDLYPCYHQEGEMHKRRPAIVVKVERRGITVVPVTSKAPEAYKFNRALFQLEQSSVANIKELDTGKRSFAVCDMIQTISPNRILPPESRDYKGRDRAYRRDITFSRRLSRNDERALDRGLLAAVGMYSLREKLDTLIQRESERESDLGIAQQDLMQAQKALTALRARHYILSGLYQAASGFALRKDVEHEIDEYMALDLLPASE